MAERIDGIRAKVQRAKENFAWLLQSHAEFMDLNPYGVVLDENPDARLRVWRARVSAPPPAYWSLVAGDIVHNLRSSLDFVAFQLWDVNGRTGVREDGVYFHVFPHKPQRTPPDPPKIEAARHRVVNELGASAAAIWDRLQPYRAGDSYEAHPLYVLHHLDIWDKHRLLNLNVYAVESQQGFIGGPGEHVHIEHLASLPGGIHGPLADGAVLQSLTLGADTPQVEMEVKFTLHITFEQGGPGRGKPLVKTLDDLISFVDEAITKFAPLVD